jgi:hypothetical protein
MSDQHHANCHVAEWHSKVLVDRADERIGKLQCVRVDVENDEPRFTARDAPLVAFG